MASTPDPAPARVPPVARWLGLAGLVPAGAAVAMVLLPAAAEWRYLAVSAGAIYAALILSFLGGAWWGLAARSGAAVPAGTWVLAVLPSLSAWALLIALAPARIVALGVLLILCLMVDRLLVAQGVAPGWWMQLRIPLSLALGALTILLGVLARGILG
jgi:hypothetical protein